MVWGRKNDRVLQGVGDTYGLPPTYTHVCPNQTYQRYRSFVRESVLRNIDLGASAIQQAEVGEAVAVGDIRETCRRAIYLSCANIGYEKVNLAHVRNQEKQSLEAVGI